MEWSSLEPPVDRKANTSLLIFKLWLIESLYEDWPRDISISCIGTLLIKFESIGWRISFSQFKEGGKRLYSLFKPHYTPIQMAFDSFPGRHPQLSVYYENSFIVINLLKDHSIRFSSKDGQYVLPITKNTTLVKLLQIVKNQ